MNAMTWLVVVVPVVALLAAAQRGERDRAVVAHAAGLLPGR